MLLIILDVLLPIFFFQIATAGIITQREIFEDGSYIDWTMPEWDSDEDSSDEWNIFVKKKYFDLEKGVCHIDLEEL